MSDSKKKKIVIVTENKESILFLDLFLISYGVANLLFFSFFFFIKDIYK